jgi:5-methylcytosine-specific restriction endonuclease McrA
MSTEYAKRMVLEPWRRWYNHAHWKRLRGMVLNRDPVCMKCHRYPSRIADHIKPHKGIWELFADLENLQGLCKHCHDEKTAIEDGGFGNVPKVDGNEITSTSVGKDLIDAALADIDAIANLDV